MHISKWDQMAIRSFLKGPIRSLGIHGRKNGIDYFTLDFVGTGLDLLTVNEAGETVHRHVNDKHDQIRFVGR
jgi:hypothetical protein